MSIITVNFWRRLTNFWSVVFMTAIIYDFFHGNALDHNQLLLPIAVIYDAALALYSAEKEFKRWKGGYQAFHPGELYVIFWTILLFGLICASILLHADYHVPAEATSSYLVVIGILAITKESKLLYREGKDKKPVKK